MTQGLLSAQQLFWVASAAMFPTIILLLPGDLLRVGGAFAWWTPLAAAAPAAALSWGLGAAATREGDLVQAARRGLGPLVGRAVLVFALAAVGAYIVVAVREAINLAAAIFIFRQVPAIILDGLGVIPAAFLAWLGTVAIGRAATLVAISGLAVNLGVLIAALPSSHVRWALPLIPRNLAFVTPRALTMAWIWLAEPALVGTALLHRVIPRDRARAGGALAAAVVLAAVTCAANLWVITANIGTNLASRLLLPFSDLVQGVTFGNIQHLETLVLPLLVVGSALKLSIFSSVWGRLGEGLLGGCRRVSMMVGLLASACLALVLLDSPQQTDRALFHWIGQRALPVLVVAMLLVYAVAQARRRAGTR